jgi:hypothetical protein
MYVKRFTLEVICGLEVVSVRTYELAFVSEVNPGGHTINC